jgi:hypothetical protein
MKAKLVKLSLSLLLVITAVLANPPKAETACVAICNPSGWCCCGRLAAYDYCTGAPVCVTMCIGRG